jgi:RimJ/RimL family protein N-acetyltransferase
MLPRLETARLLLPPLVEADLDALHSLSLLTAPEVRRYLCDDAVLSRDAVAELQAKSAGLTSRGLGLWSITLLEGGSWAGCVGLQPVPDATSEARRDLVGAIEILVALAPAFWGRGYAAEAGGAVLHHAFATLGLSRVVALVDAPNAASHRLMRHLGFRPAGACPGPRHPLKVYALMAAEREP